jgi:transcription initiation factor TFIID subunit 5
MSATPDADTPENDREEPLLVNGVAINQLSGRALDQLAAQVLQERGYADIAATIQARSGGLVSGVQAQPSMTPADLVNRHLPRNKPTGDSLYDKPAAITRLATSLASESGRQRLNPPNSSLMEMKDAAASQLLREDPLNRQEAFRDLQAWVEGSLDMYKVRHTVLYIHKQVLKYSLA